MITLNVGTEEAVTMLLVIRLAQRTHSDSVKGQHCKTVADAIAEALHKADEPEPKVAGYISHGSGA